MMSNNHMTITLSQISIITLMVSCVMILYYSYSLSSSPDSQKQHGLLVSLDENKDSIMIKMNNRNSSIISSLSQSFLEEEEELSIDYNSSALASKNNDTRTDNDELLSQFQQQHGEQLFDTTTKVSSISSSLVSKPKPPPPPAAAAAAPHYFLDISLSYTNATTTTTTTTTSSRTSTPRSLQSLGESTPYFLSTTLDWWSITTKGWDNSSIINANLAHPRLRALAKGLHPYILRIGGSQADEIVYSMKRRRRRRRMEWNDEYHIQDDDQRQQSREMKQHNDDSTNNTNDSYEEEEEEEYDTQIFKECQKRPQKCFTHTQWDNVLSFAQETGAQIVFTIAYIRHTRGEILSYGEDHSRNDYQDWDSRNAKRFLEYTYAATTTTTTASANSSRNTELLFGFELGNEVRHKNKVSNITRLVNAYKELRNMVAEIWNGGNYYDNNNYIPKILGPASTGVKETSYLLSQIGPYIDIASYHKYHGGGKDPNLPSYARYPSFYPHPVKLSGPGEAVKKYVRTPSSGGGEVELRAAASTKKMSAQMWIGEGAMAYDSGLHDLTDTFHGSLWFANILGALTKTKPLSHSVYCRQTLLGGYYELISHETLTPNPDYWVAYLWKKLVGTKAIGPIISPQRKDSVELSSYRTFGCCKQPGRDDILVHAFCAASTNTSSSSSSSRGDVVFIVINTSKTKPIDIKISMSEENRSEFILTPNQEHGLKSRQVYLNGKLLSIHEDETIGYTLPNVHELGVPRRRGEPFHIPPISIAFIVVHDTQVTLCMP